MPKFHTKLKNSQHNNILYIKPVFELLPIPMTRFDDPFLPFSKSVISATQDLVAGYLFDFPAYLAMGGAGAVALERSIAYVPSHCITILHGSFTGIGYSAMCDNFNLDAITVSTETDLTHYTNNTPHMAFLVSDTDNQILDQVIHNLSYQIDNQTMTLQVTDTNFIYQSKLENFTDKIREGLLTNQ